MPDEKPRSKHETEKQRWDRNFADLLQELRVAQTGVQILFAFLLTLPFSSGFPKTSAFQKDTYVVALIVTTLAFGWIHQREQIKAWFRRAQEEAGMSGNRPSAATAGASATRATPRPATRTSGRKPAPTKVSTTLPRKR